MLNINYIKEEFFKSLKGTQPTKSKLHDYLKNNSYADLIEDGELCGNILKELLPSYVKNKKQMEDLLIVPEAAKKQFNAQMCYQWQNNSNKIKKLIENWVTNKMVLKDLDAQFDVLESLNLQNEDGSCKIIGDDTPVSYKVGKKDVANTLGNMKNFVKSKKGSEDYDTKSFSFPAVKVIKLGDNPYEHPLTKSMGIDFIDDSFIEENKILSKAAYDSISGGLFVDGNSIGMLNITNTEASKVIDDFKPVKKLVLSDDKVLVTQFYVL